MANFTQGVYRSVADIGVGVVPGGRCQALYVGKGGSLTVRAPSGTATFKGLKSGQILPVAALEIIGGTAGDLVALARD